MAANRHHSAPLATDEPFGEREVDDRADVVLARGVLGDAHRPDEDGALGRADHPRELEHLGAIDTGCPLEVGPVQRRERCGERVEAGGVAGDEVGVAPAVVDHLFHHAGQEGEVSAAVDLEEAVGDPRPEQGALRNRRNPVALHAGLPVRIDADHLGPRALGVVEVLHRDRLVVGGVRADEDDQVGADPVAVGAGRGSDPERFAQSVGARRVADARGVVDRPRAERAPGLLRRIVGLVRHPSAGQEGGDPLRGGGADPRCDQIERHVPARLGEPGLAGMADHRVGQTAELAQLRCAAAT